MDVDLEKDMASSSRASACTLFSGRGGSSEIWWEAVAPGRRVGDDTAHSSPGDLEQTVDVWGTCVCVFCVFLGVLFQRDAVFHRHLVFLMEETVLKQTRNLCHAPIVPQYINHSGTNSCFWNKCYWLLLQQRPYGPQILKDIPFSPFWKMFTDLWHRGRRG